MEFFAQALTATITGTLSIPEPQPTHAHPPGKHDPLPPSHPFPGGPIPAPHLQHIHKTGHVAFLVFTIIFGVFFFATIFHARKFERKLRLFHHITILVIFTSFLSYLIHTFNIGSTFVPVLYRHTKGGGGKWYRQLFYGMFFQWSITTPLILLELALLSGMPLTNTIHMLLSDLVMVLTAAISALSRRAVTTWFFFGLSDLIFLHILFTLLMTGRRAAKLQSTQVQRTYIVSLILLVSFWSGIPVVFALAKGWGLFPVDVEVILYGIMEVLSNVGITFYILLSHSHSEAETVVISDFWVLSRGERGYGVLGQEE